jgi:hypothetical protein
MGGMNQRFFGTMRLMISQHEGQPTECFITRAARVTVR